MGSNMNHLLKAILFALCLFVPFSSCALFDSGIEWQDGRFALLWIDLPDDVALEYQLDRDRWEPLIDKRVFAIGSDQRYIVAKQHPNGDKSRTNFYVIDKSKDEFHCVQGPMAEAEYLRRNTRLHLPRFTKVLESLQ